MRKITLAAVGLLAAASLTACGTDPGAQGSVSCMNDGAYAVGCEHTITYKGNPLNCVASSVHGGAVLSCDFVEYNRLYGPTEVTR